MTYGKMFCISSKYKNSAINYSFKKQTSLKFESEYEYFLASPCPQQRWYYLYMAHRSLSTISLLRNDRKHKYIAISRHWSGSTSAQAMACCLLATSHYLNQYWLIIKSVLHHSPESTLTRSAHEIDPQPVFINYAFKITTSPGGQWVNGHRKEDLVLSNGVVSAIMDNSLRRACKPAPLSTVSCHSTSKIYPTPFGQGLFALPSMWELFCSTCKWLQQHQQTGLTHPYVT